ncbi:LuxR C-terminal-related transcriptional regulator [Rhodococcus sp. OK302]|uniref:LuxR C-terminal-related transcriptional regulator n=1 Tax=Rhodococcus sp. OK302 TaxID=1882769 RepID=UPI000B93CA26|nr:LuxR family transcriptional regulator [Rhodococcus sp. OK302]OYD69317.1 transcriptional regulator [Rhodococcus sp. OK302]
MKFMAGDWPLVGRDEELRMIGASLTSLDDCGGVVIAGPAGVGKSRLAKEAIAGIHSDGCVSRWAGATESARTLPLGAFAEWAGDISEDSMFIVRSVISRLTAAAPGVQVVIGIDDAHLLDDLSAFVVLQLVQRRLAQVVVTIRTGEPAPDAITALWKESHLQRVELAPLSRIQSEKLLQVVLGGRVERDLSDRMWTLTRGNVLYLRHLLDRELADGRILQHSGAWRWVGHPVISDSLAELIEQQIGRLPTPVGEVVDIVSLSEPISASTLARISERGAAEEAENRGLIAVRESEVGLSARLAHPLYGEVRHAQCRPLRLRRLSGKIATALSETPEVDSRDTVQRAVLWLNSDLPANSDLFSRAAFAAMSLTDFPLAERFAHESICAGAGIELRMIRAHALAVLNRADEAEVVLSYVPSDSALPNSDRVQLVTLRAIVLLYPLARPQGSAEVLAAALRELEPAAAQHLLPIQCLQLAMAAKPDEAIVVMESVDNSSLPAFPSMMAAWGLVIAFGDCGGMSEARRIAEDGYRLAANAPEITYQTIALAEFHVVALLLAGNVTEAMGVADRTYRECNDMPGRMHSMSVAIRGLATLGMGHAERACERLLEGTDGYEEADSTGYWYRYSLSLIQAFAMSGDGPAAAQLLDAANARRHPSFEYLRSEHQLAAAWVAAAGGEVSTAIKLARAAGEFAAQHGQLQREVVCLDTATRFGDWTTAGRLQALAEQVDGPRACAAARHAAALDADDPEGLQDAASQFEEMGDLLAVVDATAHAATAYRHRGRNGSALTAAARAQCLADACGASTPALREALQPSPLTPRQREIVTLAAQGMSNKGIADRLTVSVRTVEGHLYRASLKTGTTGRDDLGAKLSGKADQRGGRTVDLE